MATSGGSGDGCPGVCLMAFSGMPATDPHEAFSGSQPWNQANGAFTLQAIDAQTPLHAGDLVISGLSGSTKLGITMTIDSGFTIAGQAAPANFIAVAGAYLIAPNTTVVNPTWATLNGGISNMSLVIFSKS